MQSQDLIRHIDHHTTLILATNAASQEHRRQQLIGMLELARAAGMGQPIVDYLRRQIESLED